MLKYLIAILLLLLSAASAWGHGLTGRSDAAITIAAKGPYMAKAVLEPRTISFFGENYLTVSILDTLKAQHFYGDVKAHFTHAESAKKQTGIDPRQFSKGWFRIPILLDKPGPHQLKLNISNSEVKEEFILMLDVYDGRRPALLTAAIALLGFAAFIGTVAWLVRHRTRNQELYG